MKREIHYLNTDFDLVAACDLTSLAAELDAKGVFALHVDNRDDGNCFARFETEKEYDHPAPNIVAILTAIETLESASQDLLSKCTKRELNIGYDCGETPKWFTHEIDAETLGRMARLGISLVVTLYPPDLSPEEILIPQTTP